MFAGSGVTKLDLALYYARVGDWLLPELLRRPVTVIRRPTGDIKDPFPRAPRPRRPAAGGRHHRLRRRGGLRLTITITEPKVPRLTQFGAVEFHLLARRRHLEHPDLLVMDLDPGRGAAVGEGLRRRGRC